MLTVKLNAGRDRDLQLTRPTLCWALKTIPHAWLKAKLLASNLSKTQIDRLGDRLREGSFSESDLRLLDDYRRSFGEAYELVVRTIREELQLEPTGRPAKSTSSLIEKLHRETIRLSQVQDIAGCRVVVVDVAEQDRVVVLLSSLFPGAAIVDRRANPSYDYRAVHVIAQVSGKLIEMQVRTRLQHVWAEFSEKLSDKVHPAIKYGGGPKPIREMLTRSSMAVTELEKVEIMIAGLPTEHLNQHQLRELRKQQKRMLQAMNQTVITFLQLQAQENKGQDS